jgi:hypothetical protein
VKHLGLVFCAAVLLAGTLSAQEVQRFSFNVGGGFTEPVGNTGRHLDTGWNVNTGAGYNFSSYVGAMVQFNYNSWSRGLLSYRRRGSVPPDAGIYAAYGRCRDRL